MVSVCQFCYIKQLLSVLNTFTLYETLVISAMRFWLSLLCEIFIVSITKELFFLLYHLHYVYFFQTGQALEYTLALFPDRSSLKARTYIAFRQVLPKDMHLL